MARGKVGRPELITEQLVDRMAEMVRGGAHPVHAAGALRVAKRTYYSWASKGAADLEAGRDTLYARMVVKVDEAESEAVAEAEKRVFQAGKRDYRAAVVYLSKRRPEVWGEKITVEFESSMEKVVASMSDAELELMDRVFDKAMERAEQQGNGRIAKH